MASIESIITPDLLKWAALSFRLADGTLLYTEEQYLCVIPLGSFEPEYRIHLNLIPAVVENLSRVNTDYDLCIEQGRKIGNVLFGWNDGNEIHLMYLEEAAKSPIKVFSVAKSCLAHARHAMLALYCMSFYRDGIEIPEPI